MKITNFEATGLVAVSDFLPKMGTITAETLGEILKTCNVSFVAEEINRLQSMLLCELKDSYVQQSQRYVAIDEQGYTLPTLQPQDALRAQNLMQEAMALYQTMTQMKEDVSGRPKPEHYVYGIPIEDARYILPLAIKTNVSVAMSGDKLLPFFKLMADLRYCSIFAPMRQEILALLPKKLGQVLADLPFIYRDEALTEQFYQQQLAEISAEESVKLLASFENMVLKAGLGALTSTGSKTPSQVLAGWGETATEKSRNVAKRVMGYGHLSVIEQARATFGLQFSLVTYHQQERHRLSSYYRESLENLIDEERSPIVPPTIAKSPFAQQFMDTLRAFSELRRHIKAEYHQGEHLYFLLNADPIKVIMGANARCENGMLSERICNNAQWEIREIAVKKLALLRELSEELYRDALPSCVYGVCKEGKLSCGQAELMRQKYRIKVQKNY